MQQQHTNLESKEIFSLFWKLWSFISMGRASFRWWEILTLGRSILIKLDSRNM